MQKGWKCSNTEARFPKTKTCNNEHKGQQREWELHAKKQAGKREYHHAILRRWSRPPPPKKELNEISHPGASMYTFGVVRDLHIGTSLYQWFYCRGQGLRSLSGWATAGGSGNALCWRRGCLKCRSVWDANATTAFLASGWSFNGYRWTVAIL